MSILSNSLMIALLVAAPFQCLGAAVDPCAENKFTPSCIAPCLVATYDEIVDLPNHPEKLLIDVRKPEELNCTGSIPTSINIPLAVVGQELQLGVVEFQCKYNRRKPGLNDPVIFSCREGNRAADAANIASKLGYTNVKNYVASWSEYAAKNCLPNACP